jgi:hypothetical protein
LRLLIKNKAFSVGIHLERLPRSDFWPWHWRFVFLEQE